MDMVELFCGIGGFRLAADMSGITTTWANDINPMACNVYRDRFSSRELHEGDIWELYHNIPSHDLLTAGFPCQPFSSAGKKKGTRDSRGNLFQVIIEVLKNHQPKFFILENVKRLLSMERGSHFATILGALGNLNYNIEWRVLNALHFGLPQNRERIIIIGIRSDLTEENSPVIRLANDEDLKSIDERKLDKLKDLKSWISIEKHSKQFKNWGLAVNGSFFNEDLNVFIEAIPTLKLIKVLDNKVDPQFYFTESTIERIENSDFINKFYQGVQILYNQAGGARMGYTIFGTDGVVPTLTSTASRHYERYKVGDQYRRLTNIEYARLQGFPDDHCSIISTYNQYSLYGNAVPPQMVNWVMNRLTQ